MLKQRIITALWLLPLALLGFFGLQGHAFTAFVGLVMALGGWEWARLAGVGTQPARIVFALVVLGLFVALVLVVPTLPVVLLALAWWLLATLMVFAYPRSAAWWGGVPGKLLIGLLILLPAGVALVWLKGQQQANMLILTVMLMVWTADIGAYFSGRAFGKRKLAPAVSPGKSWAGLYGGLLASVLVATGCALVLGLSSAQLLLFVPAAAVIVLFSVVGDLTESMFKRSAGIKDSSNLLPGHGGVLDRIDSLTAALPLFALLFLLTGWL
ncbi:phosphatidate cytidylyltransferase [Thiopseudomonas denitrificans]|uniref:Phosphatidate cytidylyltransferase n=1 Tax=Thiopseudomonas denitrificans TaxID=1501432 RepID=A0A4V3D5C9_9GAMM|nr:phosphatidate cytidylyltransferase [Thiopseudomonas denitrificans]TDQ39557.1 phosphatidate cytidylyltransferase [Thiopseudomonas denitrificans]